MTDKSLESLSTYLKCRERLPRLATLARLRESGGYLPISLTEDLLAIDLAAIEKQAILESTGSPSPRALEHFLTINLLQWPQELAVTAVRSWVERTDQLMWFRLLEALRSPLLPQRLAYMIIDVAFCTGGRRAIEAACDMEGLETMSSAFHGMLLLRAAQWNVSLPRLNNLAALALKEMSAQTHTEAKALPAALAWLARYADEELGKLVTSRTPIGAWGDLIRAILTVDQKRNIDKLTKLLAKPPKTKLVERLLTLWPPVWARSELSPEIVAQALTLLVDTPRWRNSRLPTEWETFAGISAPTLEAALTHIQDPTLWARSVCITAGLLQNPVEGDYVAQAEKRLSGSKDPGPLLESLPLRLRLRLIPQAQELDAKRKTPGDAFATIAAEEKNVLAGKSEIVRAVFKDQETTETEDRRAFFDLAYRGGAQTQTYKPRPGGSSNFWTMLADAFAQPNGDKIAPLTQAARQEEGIFTICFLDTLGRFKSNDQAALKLLDFIRSKEDEELRAVLRALAGIATTRATQELVAALTRPNITPSLALEACGYLTKLDLNNLQTELRAALADLSSRAEPTTANTEVRDAIASLIHPVVAGRPQANAAPKTASAATSDAQLDQVLSGKIPHYKDLSSEVKRALRTSQFFHIQVSIDHAPETIDLSPVIDMQYKALELLFREIFEEPCSRLISRGILQRRLDVLGYARPIPTAMDEFEAYIAMLPIVKDIPFFSKFKLRKMLRAICQFRPGKRFTLDGLKAFALFFLCFSRSTCRHGLNGLFPLGFSSDQELSEFVKALHVFQDDRNRAAHEGFHPDASRDINKIWRTTAEIIQTAFKARAAVDDPGTVYAPKAPNSSPIIEKKVS